jgi:hypothetical protein
MEDAKKKRRAMPSAPIKMPGGNVRGIGKIGLFTGGASPTVVPTRPGGPAQPMQTWMGGFRYNG